MLRAGKRAGGFAVGGRISVLLSENLPGMSGDERDVRPLLLSRPRTHRRRPYATIIAAGSDGEGAQRQLDRCKGWRLKRVAEPWIYNTAAQNRRSSPKTVDEDALQRAREFGAGLGEGIAQGIF